MTAMYDSHVRPLLAASGLFTDGRSSTQCGPRASYPRNREHSKLRCLDSVGIMYNF